MFVWAMQLAALSPQQWREVDAGGDELWVGASGAAYSRTDALQGQLDPMVKST